MSIDQTATIRKLLAGLKESRKLNESLDALVQDQLSYISRLKSKLSEFGIEVEPSNQEEYIFEEQIKSPCTESDRKNIETNDSTLHKTPPSGFTSSTGEQVNTPPNNSGGQGCGGNCTCGNKEEPDPEPQPAHINNYIDDLDCGVPYTWVMDVLTDKPNNSTLFVWNFNRQALFIKKKGVVCLVPSHCQIV
jgi:hypothetical protein